MSKHEGLTKVELFKPTMKWMYTTWIACPPLNYAAPLPYLTALNIGFVITPELVKGITFTSIPQGWYAIATHTPWGYPVLVMGGM